MAGPSGACEATARAHKSNSTFAFPPGIFASVPAGSFKLRIGSRIILRLRPRMIAGEEQPASVAEIERESHRLPQWRDRLQMVKSAPSGTCGPPREFVDR